MAIDFIKGKLVTLRGLTVEDCKGNYLEFINDVETLRYVEGVGYRPINLASLEEYVAANNNASNLLLGIFENQTDAHVGNIHLSNIKLIHNNCVYGIVMHRSYMGKGYAHEATRLLLRHAFHFLNIHRVEIKVVDINPDAVSLYERMGAEKEGVLREAFYFKGEYRDLIVYSILKHGFKDAD